MGFHPGFLQDQAPGSPTGMALPRSHFSRSQSPQKFVFGGKHLDPLVIWVGKTMKNGCLVSNWKMFKEKNWLQNCEQKHDVKWLKLFEQRKASSEARLWHQKTISCPSRWWESYKSVYLNSRCSKMSAVLPGCEKSLPDNKVFLKRRRMRYGPIHPSKNWASKPRSQKDSSRQHIRIWVVKVYKQSTTLDPVHNRTSPVDLIFTWNCMLLYGFHVFSLFDGYKFSAVPRDFCLSLPFGKRMSWAEFNFSRRRKAMDIEIRKLE